MIEIGIKLLIWGCVWVITLGIYGMVRVNAKSKMWSAYYDMMKDRKELPQPPIAKL